MESLQLIINKVKEAKILSQNIHYKTAEIAKFFSKNQTKWNQCYESERIIIELLNPSVSSSIFDNAYFDIVFSLSCFDWNINFSRMLNAAWKNVIPSEDLVATFRLTINEGCNDISKSFQYINYDGELKVEIAPYVVMNSIKLTSENRELDPAEIEAYSYYGQPSVTAITEYKKICFCVISIKKRQQHSTDTDVYKLSLPKDIQDSLDVVR